MNFFQKINKSFYSNNSLISARDSKFIQMFFIFVITVLLVCFTSSVTKMNAIEERLASDTSIFESFETALSEVEDFEVVDGKYITSNDSLVLDDLVVLFEDEAVENGNVLLLLEEGFAYYYDDFYVTAKYPDIDGSKELYPYLMFNEALLSTNINIIANEFVYAFCTIVIILLMSVSYYAIACKKTNSFKRQELTKIFVLMNLAPTFYATALSLIFSANLVYTTFISLYIIRLFIFIKKTNA